MSRIVAIMLIGGTLAGCAQTQTVDPPLLRPSTGDASRFIAEEGAWSFRGNTGRIYLTPSSIVRTTTNDRLINRRLPTFVERSVVHYQHAITNLPELDEPIETYLMGNRIQWEQLTRALLGDKASVYLRIERGGFAAGHRGVFYNIGPRDTFIICAHEGWHQYAHSVLQDPLPVWLDEGIACFMEGFRWDLASPDRPRFMPWANTERFDQLRQAVSAGSLISLHALVSTRPQDLIARNATGDELLNWYAQSWALVHFLYEAEAGRFRAGLQRMLTDSASASLNDHIDAALGEGSSSRLRTRRIGPEVLHAYLPQYTLAELDHAYQQFMRRIVRTGGRDAVVAGRSPNH